MLETNINTLPKLTHSNRLGGIGASGLEFHKWARKNNWRNPTDAKNSPVQMAYDTDLDVFQYLHSIGYGQHTNNHSQSSMGLRCA